MRQMLPKNNENLHIIKLSNGKLVPVTFLNCTPSTTNCVYSLNIRNKDWTINGLAGSSYLVEKVKDYLNGNYCKEFDKIYEDGDDITITTWYEVPFNCDDETKYLLEQIAIRDLLYIKIKEYYPNANISRNCNIMRYRELVKMHVGNKRFDKKTLLSMYEIGCLKIDTEKYKTNVLKTMGDVA